MQCGATVRQRLYRPHRTDLRAMQFYFAPESMTSPARCDNTVTGTVLVKLPRKHPRPSATVATATDTVASPRRVRRAFEVVAI